MSKNISNNDINYDDIPELTKEDFKKGFKNPFAGKFKNNYTIIVEHSNYDEVISVSKKKIPKSTETERMQRVAEASKLYKGQT